SGIYYTLKLINKGPVFIDTPNMEAGGVGHFKTPMRPLSAVDENIDSKQNSGENRHD
ncbi:cytochrome ubiquinol oxidase subunit I, partial [Acinetobacter baumannii]